jgi:hypothetical protein
MQMKPNLPCTMESVRQCSGILRWAAVLPLPVSFSAKNLAPLRLAGVLPGLALTTGTATRLAAFLGVAMVLNYMWAKGQLFWVPTSHDTLFILVLLTLGAVGAGRVLGIDYFLAKKYPRSWIW